MVEDVRVEVESREGAGDSEATDEGARDEGDEADEAIGRKKKGRIRMGDWKGHEHTGSCCEGPSSRRDG